MFTLDLTKKINLAPYLRFLNFKVLVFAYFGILEQIFC